MALRPIASATSIPLKPLAASNRAVRPSPSSSPSAMSTGSGPSTVSAGPDSTGSSPTGLVAGRGLGRGFRSACRGDGARDRAMEPGSDVSRRSILVDLADQLDECLVDEVLGGAAVAPGAKREREQLALVEVVDRGDEVGARGSRRSCRRDRVVDVRHPGHRHVLDRSGRLVPAIVREARKPSWCLALVPAAGRSGATGLGTSVGELCYGGGGSQRA